jgi:hypothetical protein
VLESKLLIHDDDFEAAKPRLTFEMAFFAFIIQPSACGCFSSGVFSLIGNFGQTTLCDQAFSSLEKSDRSR